MKTQSSFSQSGFTMVEIMVVIAIIGMIFGFMSQINFRAQENITKAERLANKVQSLLHTTSVSLMMGRMDSTNKASTWATIVITATGTTGHGISWNLTNSLSGTFLSPFFDADPRYEIKSIIGCSSTLSGSTNTVTIDIQPNETIFTGSTLPANANLLEIRVWYLDMFKKVVFDRRTGRIEIRRDWQTACP